MPLGTTRTADFGAPTASRSAATESETAIMRAAEPKRRYLIHFFSGCFGSDGPRNSEWACQTICSLCPRSRSINFASRAATS